MDCCWRTGVDTFFATERQRESRVSSPALCSNHLLQRTFFLFSRVLVSSQPKRDSFVESPPVKGEEFNILSQAPDHQSLSAPRLLHRRESNLAILISMEMSTKAHDQRQYIPGISTWKKRFLGHAFRETFAKASATRAERQKYEVDEDRVGNEVFQVVWHARASQRHLFCLRLLLFPNHP